MTTDVPGSSELRKPVFFAFNEDQELLRSTTRRFLEKRASLSILRERIEEAATVDRAVWADGAALGWTAMLIPEAHDGGCVTGQPIVDLAGLAEELGRCLYPGPVLETNVVASVLVSSGTPEQQARFLSGIARGETIATWCLSGNGSTEPEAIEVTATLGEGSVMLNGRACFVREAQLGDVALVHANGPNGPVLALVMLPAKGIAIRALHSLDVTRRMHEVTFDNVVIEAKDLLAAGDVQTINAVTKRALQLATVVQAAECVGAAEHLMEVTVAYLKDRVQFGRTIGSFQAIKHRLADLTVTLESLRAAARYGAMALADSQVDCDQAVAAAGSYVREAFAFLCGESLQLHGGIGFTWEHDVHLFLRRAKTDLGLYGEPYVHREYLTCLLETANDSVASSSETAGVH
jgi:alkylation response protein AidB-like acyl-CoA dehydrogenase